MGNSQKSPLPGALRLVPPPAAKDDDELEFKYLENVADPLDALDNDRFEPGDIIQHETSLPSMRFLEILQGLAKETLYRDGRSVGEVINLQPGHIIGLTRFVRVEADTTLIVRVIDLKLLSDQEEYHLLELAIARLLDMALNQNRAIRSRSADLMAELKETERREISLMEKIDGLNGSMRALRKEYSGRIEKRMGELVGKRIKRLRDENTRLREDKARFEKDIEADLKSQQSILETVQVLASEQDEEIRLLKEERDSLRQILEGVVTSLKK